MSSAVALPVQALLHLPRTIAELDELLVEHLRRALPDRAFALLLHRTSGPDVKVELRAGADCPLSAGTVVAADLWQPPGACDVGLRYHGDVIGRLRVWPAPDAAVHQDLDDVLQGFAVAFVNLSLHDDLVRANDQYLQSLQLMEDGVSLFQEVDPEIAAAKLLGLYAHALDATVGALYTLERMGEPQSRLCLDQALGIPEAVLDGLRTEDGRSWPQAVLTERPLFLTRSADGAGDLAGLVAPAAMTNVAALPLCYHGVTSGLVLVFNAPEGDSLPGRILQAERLIHLGAALLHRFRLEQEAVRSREVETQLEIAGAIQRRLLPIELPDADYLDCAWRSDAAQFIGGDYVDLLTAPRGQTLAMIADVAGHGIDSALLMSSFRAAYRAQAARVEPADLMAALNHEVRREVSDTGMFITSAAFTIAGHGRSLVYASAGHNPQLLYRAATGAIDAIDSTGPPMGFLDCATFEQRELAVEAGDVLLLYTDGVVEAQCRDDGEMFGEERLAAVLTDHAGAGARQILDAVIDALTGFAPEHREQDDVTVAVVKFR